MGLGYLIFPSSATNGRGVGWLSLPLPLASGLASHALLFINIRASPGTAEFLNPPLTDTPPRQVRTFLRPQREASHCSSGSGKMAQWEDGSRSFRRRISFPCWITETGRSAETTTMMVRGAPSRTSGPNCNALPAPGLLRGCCGRRGGRRRRGAADPP